MAKKPVRKTIRSSTRSTTTAGTRVREATAAEAARNVDLGTEYHYVIRDLTTIAIIAAVLVAGLVVLSFFI